MFMRTKEEVLFSKERLNVFALKEEVVAFDKEVRDLKEITRELKELERDIKKGKEIRKYYNSRYWAIKQEYGSGKESNAARVRVKEVMDMYGLKEKMCRRDTLLNYLKN